MKYILIALLSTTALAMPASAATGDDSNPCILIVSKPQDAEASSSDTLKAEFENKFDPDNIKNERLGWGKTESLLVKEFKSMCGENYDYLFHSARFDLNTLAGYTVVAHGATQQEAFQFFGEMLRMMDQKQMVKSRKTVMKIAKNLTFGHGLLGAMSGEVIAGQRKFEWDIIGSNVSVEISDYKEFGW